MAPRTYVQLEAVWGNDDAFSRIRISRRKWSEIQNGASFVTSARSWYEGSSVIVFWSFDNAKVTIEGADGLQCVVNISVEKLAAELVTSGEK